MWGEDFTAFEQSGRLLVQSEDRLLDLPPPGLFGAHQIVNAGTAVAAAMELPGFDIPESAIEAGLTKVSWPGRMQRLTTGPLSNLLSAGGELWLDGGHNPAAGTALAQTLADLEERSSKPVHLIVGMMGLKDAHGYLSPFAGLARSAITVPVPAANDTPHTPHSLAEIANACGINASSADSIEDALRRLEAENPGNKRVVICGSLYLAGHVLGKQTGVAVQPN